MALFFFGRPPTTCRRRLDLRVNLLLLLCLGRSALGVVTTEAMGKFASVIRVYSGIVRRARNRYVREAVIYQEFTLVCVHVNQNSIRFAGMAECYAVNLALLCRRAKTAKSKAPVPVIPQLALRLDEHRIRSGKPATGPSSRTRSAGHSISTPATNAK